jgi:GLPGLI family protein
MNNKSYYPHYTPIAPFMQVFGLLLAGLFSIPASLSAQVRQGTVVYERKIDVHRRIRDDQMLAMMPRFQTASYELLFSDSVSVYKAMPKDEAPDPFDRGGGGGRIVMKFGGPGDDGVLYKDYAGGTLLEEAVLDDTKYIISDSIKAAPWKLNGETRTILGHMCKSATQTTSRGKTVVAWYTEDLSLPAGPERFSGLPGVILAADVDSGAMVFTATQILPAVDGKELRAPKGGKLITRADFERKQDEVLGPADADGKRMIRRN